MKKVLDVLKKKGTEVASVAEDSTVLAAAQRMNARRIGSLAVIRGEEVVGIFTERDILTRVVAAGKDPEKTKVSEVMTSPIAVCHRDTSLDECRAVMTEKRIRHLPVVEDGRLHGIITSGDVLAFEATERKVTIEYLYSYLYGTTPDPET